VLVRHARLPSISGGGSGESAWVHEHEVGAHGRCHAPAIGESKALRRNRGRCGERVDGRQSSRDQQTELTVHGGAVRRAGVGGIGACQQGNARRLEQSNRFLGRRVAHLDGLGRGRKVWLRPSTAATSVSFEMVANSMP
jgi:hypothetical protein